jgi:hypothetical protein
MLSLGVEDNLFCITSFIINGQGISCIMFLLELKLWLR